MQKKLSIVIANRNDTSMLAVTVRSCIEELRPLGKGNGEIIIVDNSDPNIYTLLASVLPLGYCKDKTLRIYHQDFPCLFTARETAVEKSSGEYIFCIDSHMLVGHNCLLDLVNFMDRHLSDPTIAFAHAPISWAHQHEQNAKHSRDMSVNELGDWNTAYNYERTITWKGMPWICRREWFLDKDCGLGGYGALSKHRISWGGGDMHIGVKPWLLGFKNWAVPTSPCIHIGPFPKIDNTGNPNVVKVSSGDGYKYRLWANSGFGPHALGFLISCYVLGGEPMMHRNKGMITKKFGKFINVEEWWDKSIELGQEEKQWLDNRKIMSFEQMLKDQPWNNS